MHRLCTKLKIMKNIFTNQNSDIPCVSFTTTNAQQ